MSGTRNDPDLNLDIIFNIFARLPAEILCDLRYQCKSWFNMISSVSFINTHLQRSKPGLLFIKPRPYWRDRARKPFKPIKHTSNPKITFREYKRGRLLHDVLDTCNGLLLYGGNRNMTVSNPMTGHVRQFPYPPGHDRVTASNLSQELSGITYMASAREYKVMHCFCPNGNMACCDVLTLGGDIWKRVNIPFNKLRSGRCSQKIVFFNGVAHWLAYEDCGYGTSADVMISLDIVEDKFYKTKLPKSMRYMEKLIEMQSGLYYITGALKDSRGIDHWRIWVMNDLYQGDWVELEAIKLESLHRYGLSFVTSIEIENVLVFRQRGGRVHDQYGVHDVYDYVAYDVCSKHTEHLCSSENTHEHVVPFSGTLVSPRNFISG